MKTTLFHITGMHCKACTLMTESELGELAEVSSVKASLARREVTVTGDFGEKSSEEILSLFNDILKKHGYTLSLEKPMTNGKGGDIRWSDFNLAVPISLAFIAFFILLQKLGIVNWISATEVTYGTAFVIGLIASISTCMAVVGGLVLSVSSNFAKEGDKIRPQLFFHVGRLIAFFVLGGAIGALGSAFHLGARGTFILGFLTGLVMLILGINLLDVFHWAKKFQPTLPPFIAGHLRQLKTMNHTLTPVLLGIATFFLPCGFTQSMQIVALGTGSFLTGALTMSAFALGTLPVLSLLSFGSLGLHSKAQKGVFYKVAGLVVIFFGLLNLYNSFVLIGLIPPLLNL